jgi:hypothetical protein
MKRVLLIFCDVANLRPPFEPRWQRRLLVSGARQRRPARRFLPPPNGVAPHRAMSPALARYAALFNADFHGAKPCNLIPRC